MGALSGELGPDGAGWVVWMINGMIMVETAEHQTPNLVLQHSQGYRMASRNAIRLAGSASANSLVSMLKPGEIGP